MKTEKKEGTKGLFTMSRQGSGELTHKAVEYYLSKGRRMQSAYACEVLCRLYRWVGVVLARTFGWIRTISGRRHRRRIEISTRRKFYY
jgi:hypothetical protein